MINETTTSTLNGVDVDALKETIAYLGENPEKAKFKFRADNRWIDGSRNEAHIEDFHALGEEHQHEQTHVVPADQPALILGQDTAPNPVENLLAALSGCITTTVVYHAAAAGIEIEGLASQLEGAIDVQGFMGINPDVRKGFHEIKVTLDVRSLANPEQILELVSMSPVLDVVRNGTSVKIDIRTGD